MSILCIEILFFDKELNSDMFCKEAEELCQQAIWLPGKILLGDSTCTDNIISAFVKNIS